MSAAMQETNASILQVQDYVDHVKKDVDDMHGNVLQGTKYASEMKKRADQLRKDSVKATETAKDSVEKMTHNLNEKIENSKAVQNIESLTTTILDIASQTNLLALNASIEAARAGEHGRGFAVVAEEISSLASNSADTAKKIQEISSSVINTVNALAVESTNMISFIKEETIGSYQKMLETGEQYAADADVLSEMLHNVEVASSNIDTSMESVNSAITDVSYAIEESTSGINQIAEAVGNMTSHMQNNQSVVHENSEIAKNLNLEVHKFKFEV